MFRTALKPRWLGLFALMLLLVVAFTALGLWQLNVARDKGVSKELLTVPTLPVAPIGRVLGPHDAFPANASGRRITAIGRYDAAQQVLVTPRRLDGRDGYWVITPLVVDGTGARLAVLRGFVTSPTQAGRPPSSTVTVSGTLAPGESSTGGDFPSGQLGSVDLAALLNQWNSSIYNAFVFATSERPALSGGISRVPPPPNDPGSGLAWRNAAYALQWWMFALFAIYMWVRMVRDDMALDRDALIGEPDPSTSTGSPTAGPSTVATPGGPTGHETGDEHSLKHHGKATHV